jgi:hypothetical protein
MRYLVGFLFVLMFIPCLILSLTVLTALVVVWYNTEIVFWSSIALAILWGLLFALRLLGEWVEEMSRKGAKPPIYVYFWGRYWPI